MAAPYQFTYSSHYAQAYMHAGQAGSSQPQPSAYASQPMYYSPEPRQSMGTGSNRAPTGTRFQPGHQRCTKSGCNFTGSPPSVETHMMDRHLIYPPDWHKRSKKPEWDTDPALKGKPIPIQGTSVNLDDPVILAAWIAERQKRWPTQDRVQDKKRKLEQALQNGQLPFLAPSSKRGRPDYEQGATGSTRGRGGSRGGRGRGQRGGGLPPRPHIRLPDPPAQPSKDKQGDSEDEDDDGPPEAQSAKNGPQAVYHPTHAMSAEQRQKPPPRPNRAPHPRPPPRNPYATRPALLRNLLLPEIRMTVSNLSQAIRFLVDNDFLENVELEPGQSDERKIQVVDD